MTIIDKPIIRSLCLFLERRSSVREYIDYYYLSISKLNDLKKSLEKNRYFVFTKRIVYPEMSIDYKKRIVNEIELSGDTLVSIGYTGLDNIDKELVVEATTRGFYTALYGLWIDPVKYSRLSSEIIHSVSSIEPYYASRLAICLHRELVETPYFPDTMSSGVESIGLSLLMPRHIIYYLKQGCSIDEYPLRAIKYIDEITSIVKREIGVKRIFFDYSLSPWMDNSVVDLVEELGYKLLEPGFNYGLHQLSSLVNKLVSLGREASGFNEVMLPYAEDYRLIEAGGRGLLRARDLLLYTLSCVSGPDMIVVPQSIDKLSRFILDTYTVWLIKNKPLALRAIPVSHNPGDVVDLGKFGKIPVINY